jgi:hypothetical protein
VVQIEKVLYRGKLGMLNDSYGKWERKSVPFPVPPSRLDEPVRVQLSS